MTRQRPDARRRQRRAGAWIAATVLSGGASAQSVSDATQLAGFQAGPVVIAPSLTAGYAYDSNVFLRSEDLAPSSDQVVTLQPALQVTVPFSNSTLRLGDTLSYVDYNRTAQTAGKTSNDAAGDLTLRFGSLDNLDLSAHRVSGVAETFAFEFDPSNQELQEVLRGNLYRSHTERASISREIEGVRGYRLALERNALRFEQPVEGVIDYRGFEGEGSYLQPLSPNTRLAFGYLGKRYDHFDASPGADPHAVYRKESGNEVYAQIEGQLGPRQPYSVRVGWERLAFAGTAATSRSGLIGQARLSAIVGGGTTFTVTAQYQPYRSTAKSSSFYVFQQIGGHVQRTFPRGSSVGGNLHLFQYDFAESASTGSSPRRDRTVRLEAYANLALADRVVFRISVLRSRKYSDFAGADYNSTVVFGGFVLGWI